MVLIDRSRLCTSKGFHLLRLGDAVLSFVDSTKFLGLVFDKTVTSRQHVCSLWTQCKSALNVLCMLSGTSWGTDRVTLLRLYYDYGSIVYSCACATNLHMLAFVWHMVHFELAVLNVYLFAGEPSLSMHQDILLCSYSAKYSGFPNNPTYQSLLHPKYKSSYVDRPSLR